MSKAMTTSAKIGSTNRATMANVPISVAVDSICTPLLFSGSDLYGNKL